MPLSLGAAFAPRQDVEVYEPEPPQTTVEDLRSEQLLVALAALQEALQNMPAPQVHISEPDLTGIVNAVNGLKGPATADEIARAVVAEISPGGELGMDQVLRDVADALKQLDFRMKGMGGQNSAILPSSFDVRDRAERVLGTLNYSDTSRLPVDVGGQINVGNLTLQYESVVSTFNSTQVPLAAGATFTGQWEDVRDYAAISVAVMTDVMSAVNGAVVEFTEDTTLAPIRSIPTTILGGSGAHFSLAPQARYFRLKYTNGATAQTVMRSETTLRFNPPAQVQQPLAAPTTDANLATIVKSHLAGRQVTGAWTPLTVNSSGHVSVRVENDAALTDAQLRATPLARSADAVAAGSVQAVNSSVMLVTAGSVSSFSFDVGAFTSGTFVIERTLAPNPSDAGALWTAVGAFKAGTRTSKSTWSESGAFHGNASASTAVRIRVTVALNVAATVNLLASSGTGTITIGAIASNEGNIIGATQTLGQHYATTAGGNMSWNSSTDVLSMSSTGEQSVAALSNPAGSGVDMFILGYELNGSAITTWRRYRNATLTGLGTGQDNVNRGGDTSKTAAGRLYRGAGSTSQPAAAQFTRTGGTLGKASFLAANVPLDVDLAGEVRLRPGQNWVFTATGPGGLGGTMTATVFVDWYEIPAS